MRTMTLIDRMILLAIIAAAMLALGNPVARAQDNGDEPQRPEIEILFAECFEVAGRMASGETWNELFDKPTEDALDYIIAKFESAAAVCFALQALTYATQGHYEAIMFATVRQCEEQIAVLMRSLHPQVIEVPMCKALAEITKQRRERIAIYREGRALCRSAGKLLASTPGKLCAERLTTPATPTTPAQG